MVDDASFMIISSMAANQRDAQARMDHALATVASQRDAYYYQVLDLQSYVQELQEALSAAEASVGSKSNLATTLTQVLNKVATERTQERERNARLTQEAAASAARIKELEAALEKERQRTKKLEAHSKRDDKLIRFADAVIEGRDAQLALFTEHHPESILLQSSGTPGTDGEPRTFLREAFDEAYTARFLHLGGTKEDVDEIARLGVEVFPLVIPAEPTASPDEPASVPQP